MTGNDPFNLKRFVSAQAPVFDSALAELAAGSKKGHWMWFVFPQHAELGHSFMAQFYGIGSIEEARAYLDHEVLGERLVRCTKAVLAIEDRSLHAVFGSPDDLKFRSSMTLFASAAPKGDGIFGKALDQCCAGLADEHTLSLLDTQANEAVRMVAGARH